MINFIICDDSSNTRKEVCDLINKYMIEKDINYRTHIYKDYDTNFNRALKEKMSFKVYILDIEAPSRNGIDVAEEVRNKEPNSSIIMISGYPDYDSEMLKREIGFISFLRKDDTFQERFNRSLDRVMSIINKKKLLKFNERGVMYKIAVSDILYVVRDSIERKSVIITDYGNFYTYKSLIKLQKELGRDFYQTHKSCLLNKQRAASVNKNKNIIMLDNGENLELLSDKYKKDLVL